jgi:hypothetical protein
MIEPDWSIEPFALPRNMVVTVIADSDYPLNNNILPDVSNAMRAAL